MGLNREFLWIIKESSLGTVMTSPTAGTDSIYIRLTDSNSFNIYLKPIFEEIMWGGGYAIPGEEVSDHYELKGTLKTKLYPAQAPLLLALLCNRVNAGQTLPWVTTEPPGDLASVSIYHATERSNGSLRRKRYAGVKASGGTIEVSRGSTTAMLTLELQACRCYGAAQDASADPDATEFPAPADGDFPIGPYTFKQTSGGLKIASAVTQYESVNVNVANTLDGRWFESSYLTLNKFCGRKVSLTADLLYRATPDRRAAYEGFTDQDSELIFSNGTNTAKLDLNTKNTITGLDLDTNIGAAYMEKISVSNRYDASVSGDISASFTP